MGGGKSHILLVKLLNSCFSQWTPTDSPLSLHPQMPPITLFYLEWHGLFCRKYGNGLQKHTHTPEREIKDSGIFLHKSQTCCLFWTFTNITHSRDSQLPPVQTVFPTKGLVILRILKGSSLRGKSFKEVLDEGRQGAEINLCGRPVKPSRLKTFPSSLFKETRMGIYTNPVWYTTDTHAFQTELVWVRFNKTVVLGSSGK